MKDPFVSMLYDGEIVLLSCLRELNHAPAATPAAEMT